MNTPELKKNTAVRKHPRITPPKDVYAVFGIDKTVIGKLCDISMGGISCKHFTDSAKACDYSSLDLFTLDNELYMSGIPCSVVYTVSLDKDTEMTGNMAVKSRRIGVKFLKLNYLHQSQLKTFVGNAARWN